MSRADGQAGRISWRWLVHPGPRALPGDGAGHVRTVVGGDDGRPQLRLDGGGRRTDRAHGAPDGIASPGIAFRASSSGTGVDSLVLSMPADTQANDVLVA